MVSNTNLQLFTSIAQATFAFGLLVVTAVYTYYTRQQSEAINEQIEAMDAQAGAVSGQTKAMTMPYLKATIEHPNLAEYFFVIRNTGKGAAHNVTANWEVGTGGENRRWNIPLIAPGEKYKFFISKDDNGTPISDEKRLHEELQERGYNITFRADCEDIFEEKHHFEQDIDLQRAVWGRKETSYEWVEKPADETVAEEINSISDHIRDIGQLASSVDGDVKNLLKLCENEKYLEHIEDFDEPTVEQLAKLSQKDENVLRIELKRLADQGLVELDKKTDSVRLVTEQ